MLDWLRTYLATGPQEVAEVRAAALSLGFTNGTLRRAFRELACRATRDDAKKVVVVAG